MKKYLTIISLFVLTSCHHMLSQNVNVNPSVSFNKTDVKTTNGVKVSVSDKRVKGIIGYRWFILGGSINNYQSPKGVIANKIADGLKRNGFKAGSDWLLEVKLDSLSYRAEPGIFSVTSVAECLMSISAKDRQGVSKYSNAYQGQVRNNHYFIAPLAETNEVNINQAVAEAIKKILEDDSLMEVMSK